MTIALILWFSLGFCGSVLAHFFLTGEWQCSRGATFVVLLASCLGFVPVIAALVFFLHWSFEEEDNRFRKWWNAPWV